LGYNGGFRGYLAVYWGWVSLMLVANQFGGCMCLLLITLGCTVWRVKLGNFENASKALLEAIL